MPQGLARGKNLGIIEFLIFFYFYFSVRESFVFE